jgi:hypothetical protein
MKAVHKLAGAIIALALSATSIQAANLSPLEELQIRSEIKQLVDNYAVYRDNWDSKGYASLFTENGKLTLYGTTVEGRTAIQKRVDDADHKGRYIHVMTTSQITIVDNNNATGIQYASVYSITPTVAFKEEETVPLKGPRMIGRYFDKYVRTAEGWKIAERRLVPSFTTPE